MDSTQTVLFNIIETKTGVKPQLDFPLDMFLDSLAMAEMTCEIEQAFNIRLGHDVTYVTSVSELLAYIETCRT